MRSTSMPGRAASDMPFLAATWAETHGHEHDLGYHVS